MSKWDFIKRIVKVANKSPDLADKRYVKDIFNEATHDANKMSKLRSQLDPSYKKYTNDLDDIVNDQEYFDEFKNMRDMESEDAYLDFMENAVEDPYAETKASEDLNFYRNIRDNKDYLNKDYLQQLRDSEYGDFISYLNNNTEANESNYKDLANQYLINKYKERGYRSVKDDLYPQKDYDSLYNSYKRSK